MSYYVLVFVHATAPCVREVPKKPNGPFDWAVWWSWDLDVVCICIIYTCVFIYIYINMSHTSKHAVYIMNRRAVPNESGRLFAGKFNIVLYPPRSIFLKCLIIYSRVVRGGNKSSSSGVSCLSLQGGHNALMHHSLVAMMHALHLRIMPTLRGWYTFWRVGMMHQCSTIELFTSAALVHHDDKCHLLATWHP